MSAVSLSVPSVSQLPGTSHYIAPPDGTDANRNNNCGEAVLAAAIAFCGGPLLAPDAITDAVFGEGHTGPSAMGDYTAFLARYGVRLTGVSSGDPAALLARSRTELAAGHPSIILIPSAWGMEPPPTSGFLHFVIFKADDGAGRLTAMNPWGGFDQSGGYTWWQERIRLSSIWIVEKIAMPFDASKYTLQPDGTYKHANGVVVGSGDYAFLRDNGINDAPLHAEIPRPGSTAGETYLPLGNANSEHGVVYWDGKEARLDSWIGHGLVSLEEARAAAVTARQTAETNAAALANNVKALTGQLTDAKDALKQADADLAAAESIIDNLTDELAAAKQQVSDLSGYLSATQAALHALLAVVPVIRAALATVGIK